MELMLSGKRFVVNHLIGIGSKNSYMYTDFGGHDLSSFGDTGILKNGQISLSDYGL